MNALELEVIGDVPRRADLKALAQILAARHCSAPPAPNAAECAGAEATARGIEARRLRAGSAPAEDARALREACERQQRILDRRADAFERRVAEGHVRQTSGPLDAEDIAAIDRIGFGRAADWLPVALDRTRDVCADVAALCVVLGSRGHALQAEWLLAAYADAANDFSLYRIIDFYQSERACELALAGAPDKDELLRYATGPLPARGALHPPAVVALGGLVASGKSTVAKAVARRLSAPRVVGDHLREFTLGATPQQPATTFERLAAFEPGFADGVYAELFADAEAVLDSGRGVVLDCGFPEARERRAARALAIRYGVPFLFVECRIDEATALSRLAARDAQPDGHTGWRDIYQRFCARWKPVGSELPRAAQLVVHTDHAEAEIAAEVVAHLDALGSPKRAAGGEA